MKAQISIIGCGWLGFPLAEDLIKKGYSIKGSTTSNNKLEYLKSFGITPFQIELKENEIIGNYSEFLKKSEILIINIPPGLRKNSEKNHFKEILHLVNAAKETTIKNILFISSISVYKDDYDFLEITEDVLPNTNLNTGKQLIEIEKLLSDSNKFNTTILRFGGLFDKERHPGNYLSKKINNTNPDAPINLIHKKDCIDIITSLIKKDIWNETFNAVFPFHPKKKDYYSKYCLEADLNAPKFNKTKKSKGKIINSSKLVQNLNYTFKQAP